MNNDKKVALLQMCYLFEDLSKEDLSLIASQAKEKVLPKNKTFMEAGRRANNIYIIASGLVKVFHITEEGKEIILALRSRSNVVGEFELLDEEEQLRSVSIKTLKDTRVLVLPKDVFKTILATHPAMLLALSRYILKLLRRKNNQIELLVSQSLGDRALQILETLQKYFPDKEITLSHDDIASLVGATRPRVTEVLHNLAKENKILLGHKSIRVLQ